MKIEKKLHPMLKGYLVGLVFNTVSKIAYIANPYTKSIPFLSHCLLLFSSTLLLTRRRRSMEGTIGFTSRKIEEWNPRNRSLFPSKKQQKN
jgi:hypothetical protein